MELWLLLEWLQASSLKITGLSFWLLHLSLGNAQNKALDNEHLASPQFFLLKQYSSWLLIFLLLKGDTQKRPFCTCNQGSLSFKTTFISFCNSGSRNSSLAFYPQENRESWAWGSLRNSTYFFTRCALKKIVEHMASRGIGKFPVWQLDLDAIGRQLGQAVAYCLHL